MIWLGLRHDDEDWGMQMLSFWCPGEATLVKFKSHCKAANRAIMKHMNPSGWKNEYLQR
jgi:hypothetical protein